MQSIVLALQYDSFDKKTFYIIFCLFRIVDDFHTLILLCEILKNE